MDTEIKAILDYQTKLLEQLVQDVDAARQRSAKQKQAFELLSQMVLNNPAFAASPQARAIMGALSAGLRDIFGGGAA